MSRVCGLLLAMLLGGSAVSAQAPQSAAQIGVLARIRQTHALRCATDEAPAEQSLDDLHGVRTRFDLELCHAIAVAIAGSEARVEAVPATDEDAAVAVLLAGRADLLPTASLDLTRTTAVGLALGQPILLDGTAVLVHAGIASLGEISGKKVCFLEETETETALRAYFRWHGLDLLPYPFSEEGEMQAAFTSGNCAAIAADRTRLLPAAVGGARILPETLAPDPLAPATRAADPELGRIVLWVTQVLLEADRLGLTRAAMAQAEQSTDPAVARLLGKTHELGRVLGLDNAWPIRVLAATGSYSELLHRTLPGFEAPAPEPLPFR